MEIRLAPDTSGARNGMPEGGGYVYRGAYIDIMPWAITDDGSMDYDRGALDDERGALDDERERAPRQPRTETVRCRTCGYSVKGKNHQALCGR